jgi:hypothetical protein
MNKDITFTCSECGGPAAVVDGDIQRECGHEMASIEAHMSATVYSAGGLTNAAK